MTVHEFKQSLSYGKKVEAYVLAVMNHNTHLQMGAASLAQDKGGIDATDRNGASWQIKGDRRAHQTHNVFIELAIRGWDGTETPGWAINPKADWLCYFIDTTYQLGIIRLATITERLRTWRTDFPAREAINVDEKTGNRYTAIGITVPSKVFGTECWRVYQIDKLDWQEMSKTTFGWPQTMEGQNAYHKPVGETCAFKRKEQGVLGCVTKSW